MSKRRENAPNASAPDADVKIYAGPTVPKYALKRFQIFSGGLPPHAVKAAEAIPEISALIVPADSLDEVRAKISTAGTAEAVIYAAVKKAASK